MQPFKVGDRKTMSGKAGRIVDIDFSDDRQPYRFEFEDGSLIWAAVTDFDNSSQMIQVYAVCDEKGELVDVFKTKPEYVNPHHSIRPATLILND
jgi:hypothetical protein